MGGCPLSPPLSPASPAVPLAGQSLWVPRVKVQTFVGSWRGFERVSGGHRGPSRSSGGSGESLRVSGILRGALGGFGRVPGAQRGPGAGQEGPWVGCREPHRPVEWEEGPFQGRLGEPQGDHQSHLQAAFCPSPVGDPRTSPRGPQSLPPSPPQ